MKRLIGPAVALAGVLAVLIAAPASARGGHDWRGSHRGHVVHRNVDRVFLGPRWAPYYAPYYGPYYGPYYDPYLYPYPSPYGLSFRFRL